MPKSVSQPSFLAILVAGTAVGGRSAGPAAGDRNTPNTGPADINDCLENNGDNNNDNTEEEEDDDDDDDEDDELKRQMVMDWLQHLESVVLERPTSPVIDADVPPQTDTAIHIVYDGD